MKETSVPDPSYYSGDELAKVLRRICIVQVLHFQKEHESLKAKAEGQRKAAHELKAGEAEKEMKWFESQKVKLDAWLKTDEPGDIKDVQAHRNALREHLKLDDLGIKVSPKFQTELCEHISLFVNLFITKN